MSLEIDDTDKKILKDLLVDGRKSFADIAKECKKSKELISKRYKQMEKKGIILGSTIQNSYTCYEGRIVATILIFIERGKIDLVKASVVKVPRVFHVYSRVASQTLAAVVILRNIEQLAEVTQTIKGLSSVVAVDVRVRIGQRTTPENLSALIPETPQKTASFRKDGQVAKKNRLNIDEVDKAIIDRLACNGRMTFERIGKSLGLSTDTIVRRYERLKENGDLKVVIQINPSKIGYYAFAIFYLSFSHETLESNTQVLCRIQDINFITKSSGSFDYTLSLMIKDINQFLEVQDRIANLPGLTRMEVAIDRLFPVWPLQKEFISTF